MKSLIKKSIAALPLSLRLALAPNFSDIPQTISDKSFRTWISGYIHPGVKFFAERPELHNYVAAQYAGQPIACYHFGARAEDDLYAWTALNAHDDSRFYGFETSTPKPGDRRAKIYKGALNTTLPRHRGLFETSLPKIVVLNTDAYGTDMTIFRQVGDTIDSRCTLIIDDFSNLEGAFQALKDYGRPYMVMAATSFFGQLAIRFAAR